MSQRVNRAFYSEPLMSFPGRLHITAERSYIEVLVKEDGKRTFRTFSTEDYNTLINLLVEQDFYQNGCKQAYESELFEVSKKAKHIQELLFKDALKPVQENMQRRPQPIEPESENEINQAQGMLGTNADEVVHYAMDNEQTDESVQLSSHDAVLTERPIFEQVENEANAGQELADENVWALTSKYIGKFSNLHVPKKDGCYAKDKAVLLMSIISMYNELNQQQGPTILCNNHLKELFETKWEEYGSNAIHDDVRKTFLTLSEESFWHLNPPNNSGEYSAQIDSELVIILNQQISRNLLRKTLYSRYLR